MSGTAAEQMMGFRNPRAAAFKTFGALLLRDMRVLRRNFAVFVVRTVMQPLLLLFVFTYVFPKIGEGVGGSGAAEAAFSTILVAGVVATSIVIQGVQVVALPLVQEFGYTREIEDRVMAPLPVWGVAAQKLVSGALQALLAAAVVFPLAAVVPATHVNLHLHWGYLLTMAPLAAIAGAGLGLTIGTRFQPTQVPLIFSLVIIPITFLGAVYYPWQSLSHIRWLQDLVLVNPLVYMSEGFRTALTSGVPHMPVAAIYGGLAGFGVLLCALGIAGFKKRVLA